MYGVHDRTTSVLCMAERGVVRGKDWNRLALTHAWAAEAWEKLCGTPWQLVPPEVRLRKKATADKKGATSSEWPR